MSTCHQHVRRFAALWAAFCLCTVAVRGATNVLTNPGFESGTNGWTRRTGGTLLNSAPGRTGTNAARLTSRTATSHGIQQSLLSVIPNNTFYFASAWVRTSSETNVTINFSMQQMDDRGNRTISIRSAQVSNVWTQLTGTFAHDANGPETTLLLFVSGPPSGTDLFLDDVSFATLDPLAIENLLKNPAFETGTTGWQAHGPPMVLSSSQSHTGTNAALVTNRAAAWQGVEQNLLGRIEPGRTYFFSAWVRTDRATNDTVKLTMERRETTATNFTAIATGQASSNGWTWLSGYHTPPAIGVVTALKFFVEGPPAGVTLFVDDAYAAPVTGLRKAAANYPNVRLGSGGVSQSEVRVGSPLFGAFVDAFHHFSPGNALKLQGLRPGSNFWSLAEANMLLDFGQAHGGSSRGHVFVWHGGVAPWVTNVVRTTNELRDILWNHMDGAVERFRDRLPHWDVVNEAISDSGGAFRSTVWYDAPGIGYAGQGNKYIAEAFKRARTNLPDVTLVYNDYSIETVNTKSTAVYNMFTNFVATGVPVDALGMQAHLSGTSFDAASFRANLQRFHDLGVELHITEFDVRLNVDTNTGLASAADIAGQAEVYFDALGTGLGFSSFKLFQTWGIYDGDSWIPGAFPGEGQALPFDFNLDKKPAYWAMWNALNGQAEKLSIVTNSSGDTASLTNNALLSASNGRRFNANAVNDFVTLGVEVPFAGKWNVKIGALRTGDAGRFQLAVAPPGSTSFVNVGGVNDTYAAGSAAAEFNLGTTNFSTAGDWQFRFTVPSKNGSSSGFNLTLDFIRLTPVACEPQFNQPLSDQSLPVNSALAPALFIAEDDVAAGSLVVTATSSNPALVPNTNLVLAGGSPYYTLAATPLTNRAGSTVISLVASDGTNSVTNAFTLTVGTQLEAWRTANFGTALNFGTAADTADPDGDGFTNAGEYVRGTSPNSYDPLSGLTITNETGKILVSFTATAASGTGYSNLTRWFDLLRSTNLASGQWPGVPAYTNLVGSNQLITHTNTLGTNASYKLKIRLQ
jgi:endo-1,4-beta-xylanase